MSFPGLEASETPTTFGLTESTQWRGQAMVKFRAGTHSLEILWIIFGLHENVFGHAD
jgi:hypothetical protein